MNTRPCRAGASGSGVDERVGTTWSASGWGSQGDFLPERGETLSIGWKVFLLTMVIVMACLFPGLADSPAEVDSLGTVREALLTGDLPALEAAVRRVGSVNVTNALGDTPLILAAEVGSTEAVGWLLERGADVNAANRGGATALLRGAGDAAKVRLLLERGAKANAVSRLGHTPLMLAARNPAATESVRMLLAHGAEVNARSGFGATALMAAAAASNFEVARLLVERGAEVQAVPMPDGPTSDPIWGGLRTPLMWAAFRGDRTLAAYLIDRGADVKQVIPFGTALTHAGWRGDAVMARFLVERGADVRVAEPFSGFTPLHWAASVEDGKAEMVRFLLSCGADPLAEGGQPVDAFLGEPQTPRSLARQRGASAVGEALGVPSEGGVGSSTGGVGPKPAGGLAQVGGSAMAWAVASAVPALQKTAVVSRESFVRHGSKQNCVSCHQQYLPLAAVGLARSRGIPVDEAARKQLAELVVEVHGGADVEAEPLFHPDAAHDFGYALLGLRLAGGGGGRVAERMVHHLAAIQNLDGHWSVNLIRPPMQSSDITATALAVHALKHFGWRARAGEFEERVGRARRWLERAEPSTLEERTYQILGLAWTGLTSDTLNTKGRAVRALQRSDGGWAQLPGLESDAYATGQALYTLVEAAGLRPEDEVIQRGLAFLLRTQGDDGTWHVKRRAFPFQPTMESGFPHGRDSWISASGTSWAVLALARAAERLSETDARVLVEAVKKRDAKRTVGAEASSERAAVAAVDFVRDVQPILERSCVPCHSGERARGKYRMTDRRGVLEPGNGGVATVVPGRARDSLLIRYVGDEVEEFAMPPLGKRGTFPALSEGEIARLRAWVDGGALWPDGVVLGAARTAVAKAP